MEGAKSQPWADFLSWMVLRVANWHYFWRLEPKWKPFLDYATFKNKKGRGWQGVKIVACETTEFMDDPSGKAATRKCQKEYLSIIMQNSLTNSDSFPIMAINCTKRPETFWNQIFMIIVFVCLFHGTKIEEWSSYWGDRLGLISD